MRCARSPTSRRPSRKPSRSPQPHDDSPPGSRVVINLKTPHELGIMRRAGLALSKVTEELVRHCRPGVKTADIDKLADRRIREAGGRPGFLGYNGFPKSICISINDEAAHGIPRRRQIADRRPV